MNRVLDKKVISAWETATFCSQVALIVKAGIPLYDGMNSLTESCENEESREIFKKISQEVTETGSLYRAVECANVFPNYMVNMIKIGEETGKLEEVLESLSTYYEREAKLKQNIKSAVTYPAILVMMMSVVILVLVLKVIPIFEKVFNNLGTDIPESGRAFMNIGKSFGLVTLIVVLSLAFLVGLLVFVVKIGRGDLVTKTVFKLPFLRNLNAKLSSGRFAAVMSMVLGSGYSIEKALEIAPDIVSDKYTKSKLNEVATLVKEGKSFPEALIDIDMFDGLQNRIIKVGFKSGQLDTVMEKVATLYEDEVDTTIEKIVSFIEPLLVAILSLIIGGILISVMLPLASIMSSLG